MYIAVQIVVHVQNIQHLHRQHKFKAVRAAPLDKKNTTTAAAVATVAQHA